MPPSNDIDMRLDVLASLAQQIMKGKEAAEIVLRGLESIAALVRYDYALLELIPGFGQNGAPTIFRVTPAAIEAVTPASVLVDESAHLFSLTAGESELGRLRVVAAGESLSDGEIAALKVLAGYFSLALKMAEMETTARRLREMDATLRRQNASPKSDGSSSRRTRTSGLKAELSQILSAQLGLTVLCERVLERLVTVLDVDAGAVFIFDERAGDLLRKAQRGVPGPLPARLAIGNEAPTAMGRATAMGAYELTANTFAIDLDSDEDRVLRTWGFYSLLCYPMISGKRVVGGIQLMSRRANGITNKAVSLLNALSDELALALANAMTFDRLSTMAVTDGLTGLHNRRFCEEFIRKHLMAAQRSQRSCGFLLVDIDHFKSFNDRFGHAAGDVVLRRVADVVGTSIRAADLAGRYGGEEFLVALPNADLDTALAVAERIRTNIREMPIDIGDGKQRVTVSIGSSSFPECAATLSQLFSSADGALYAAKESGRDCVLAAPKLPAEEEPEHS